jgi:hypothetical protein
MRRASSQSGYMLVETTACLGDVNLANFCRMSDLSPLSLSTSVSPPPLETNMTLTRKQKLIKVHQSQAQMIKNDRRKQKSKKIAVSLLN